MRLARVLRFVDQNVVDAVVELVERPGGGAIACEQRTRALDHVVEVEYAARALERGLHPGDSVTALGRENRERAERIAAAVITEAGTAAGTPGSRYGSTIRECAPIIGAYAVMYELESGESLKDGAGGWNFTAALHGIISAVVNDSPEPGAFILERGPLYGFNPAAYDLEPADYDLEPQS